MTLNSKKKTIGILLLLALYISFPFFRIKYFEISTSLHLIYTYLLIPILFVAIIGTIIIYIKYLRKFNEKTNSKTKIFFQDFFTTILLTCIASGILLGMAISTIVTTNAYVGQSEEVRIKGTVLNYSTNTTKWGKLRHRIEFTNSYNQDIINLEVYRKYEIGEEFNKDMKIGKWGLLYSMD